MNRKSCVTLSAIILKNSSYSEPVREKANKKNGFKRKLQIYFFKMKLYWNVKVLEIFVGTFTFFYFVFALATE